MGVGGGKGDGVLWILISVASAATRSLWHAVCPPGHSQEMARTRRRVTPGHLGAANCYKRERGNRSALFGDSKDELC
jgi:hypothetical protein